MQRLHNMKKSVLLTVVVILLTFIAGYELAITNSTTPPVSTTGAPGEGTCAGCHGNLNTGPGDILFSLDTINYTPGNTYIASLQVVDGIKSRFGFEIARLLIDSIAIGRPNNASCCNR